MTNYQEKRQNRIDRMILRAERLEAFAKGKDLSLFSESRSGIPLGQPILVGHHSEKRHRKHLERLNKLIERGYAASDMAARLRSRAASIESNRAIQVDNPDARELIQAKIDKLQKFVDAGKLFNSYIRKIMKVEYSGQDERVTELARLIDASPYKPTKYSSMDWAAKLLTPYHGSYGVQSFELTNSNAEIRRLKKRLIELDKIESFEFQDIETDEVSFKLVDGQFQVKHDTIPSEEIRSNLKSLGFKWSRYSTAWVRKQTGTTNQYWIERVKAAI